MARSDDFAEGASNHVSYDVCPECNAQPGYVNREAGVCPTCDGSRVVDGDQAKSYYAARTVRDFKNYGGLLPASHGGLRSTKLSDAQQETVGADGARIRYGVSEAGHYVIHSPDKALNETMPGQSKDSRGLDPLHRLHKRVVDLAKGE